jgi:hypothetical protein
MVTTALFLTDDRTSEATTARLMTAHRLGIVKRGEVVMTRIAHDDDRPALDGGGCACTPDLEVMTPRGTWAHRGRSWARVVEKN